MTELQTKPLPGAGAIKLACTRCDTEVRRSPSTLKKSGGRAFCSHLCFREWWRGRPRTPRKDTGVTRGAEYVDMPCSTCRTPVHRRKTDIKGQRVFCKSECRITWLKLRPPPGRPGATELDRTKTVNGYLQVYVGAKNTSPGKKGYELVHRQVMAEAIGRPLTKIENVHHKNGDRADNSPENLELWVCSQPHGQRVEDLVAWAEQIIDTYKPILPLLP